MVLPSSPQQRISRVPGPWVQVKVKIKDPVPVRLRITGSPSLILCCAPLLPPSISLLPFIIHHRTHTRDCIFSMMRCAVLLLLCSSAMAAKVAFTCDADGRTVNKETKLVTLPCKMVLSQSFIVGTKKFERDFTLETTECSKSFRLLGKDWKDQPVDLTITEEDNTVNIPNKFGLCEMITFDQITTSEDGISFCPSLPKCAAFALDCVTIAAPDTCTSYTDCATCTDDPSCGWCYDSEAGSCLPLNDEKTTDRCALCEDLTIGHCPKCDENCGGHGLCNDEARTCTCDPGWIGDGSCNVYDPSAMPDPCANINPSTFEVDFPTASAGLYHEVITFGSRRVSVISFILLSGDAPMIYLKRGQPALSTNYDVKFDSAGGSDPEQQKHFTLHRTPQACHGASSGTHLFTLTMPPIDEGEDLWISTPTKATISIHVEVCKGRFYGAGCDIPESDLDENEVETARTHHPEEGAVTKTVKHRVALQAGAAHFLSFPVYPYTVKLSVVAKALTVNSKVEAQIQLYRDNVKIPAVSIIEPVESEHWGALVTVPADSTGFTTFLVEFSFDECYVDSEEEIALAPNCGPPLAVLDVSPDVDYPNVITHYTQKVAFEVGQTWAVAKVTLRHRVASMKVSVEMGAGASGYRLFARYRAPPSLEAKVDDVQTEGGNGVDSLDIEYPEAGVWYVAVHQSAAVEGLMTFTVTASACSPTECEADKCSLTTEVPATHCTTETCSKEKFTYPIAECSGSVVPRGNSGGNGLTPKSDGSGSDGGSSRAVMLGIGLGLFGLVAIGAGMYMVSIFAVKRDRTRRERGGYDIPTLEDDENSVDIEEDRPAEIVMDERETQE